MKFLVYTAAFLILLSCATPAPPPPKEVVSTEYITKGDRFLANQQTEEAIQFYKKALATGQNNSPVHIKIAAAYLQKSEYRGALPHLEIAYKEKPQDPALLFMLGEAYRGVRKYSKALFFYEAAQRIQPKVKGYRAIAWTLYKMRSYNEAYKAAREALKRNPNDLDNIIIATRIFTKVRKFKSAWKVLRPALRGAEEKAASKAALRSVAGDLFYASGKNKQAAIYYLKAIQVDPFLAGALYGYSKCLLKIGKATKAKDFLKRAIKSKPDLAEPYLTLAKITEKENPLRASKLYTRFYKIARMDPEHLEATRGLKQKIATLKQSSNVAGQ
jgi:tetratricopeptide (TPR) repeat protein